VTDQRRPATVCHDEYDDRATGEGCYRAETGARAGGPLATEPAIPAIKLPRVVKTSRVCSALPMTSTSSHLENGSTIGQFVSLQLAHAGRFNRGPSTPSALALAIPQADVRAAGSSRTRRRHRACRCFCMSVSGQIRTLPLYLITSSARAQGVWQTTAEGPCITKIQPRISILVEESTNQRDGTFRILFHNPVPGVRDHSFFHVARGEAHHRRHGRAE
jgi:hypothetical protein